MHHLYLRHNSTTHKHTHNAYSCKFAEGSDQWCTPITLLLILTHVHTYTHIYTIPLGKLQTSRWMFRAAGPHQCSAAQQNTYQATRTICKQILDHPTFILLLNHSVFANHSHTSRAGQPHTYYTRLTTSSSSSSAFTLLSGTCDQKLMGLIEQCLMCILIPWLLKDLPQKLEDGHTVCCVCVCMCLHMNACMYTCNEDHINVLPCKFRDLSWEQ